MLLTGAEIIAEVLIEQGVDTVFGYPGGSVLNIYDALYAYSDKIKHYMSAHEQGAAHAADGYARLTGKTGVVISTSGPGATNLVTGIATAYMDSVPLVAITGNVPTSLIGRDSFQEVYIAGITMPITKHNFTVRSVEELADTLRQAFLIANEGRPGPVLVDIPKDVTINKTSFENKTPEIVEDDRRLKHLEKVADLINASKFPVVYFGGGVRISGAEDELYELLHKANIPATYTMMAAGVLGYNDPLSMGLVGMHGSRTANLAVDNADLVLAIGTRFSDRVALNANKFARRARIVHIDIDPSEVNKNVAVDTSIIGDVKKVLTALIPMVDKADHTDWLEQIALWKAKDYTPKDDATVLKPHQVMGAICDIAGEDTVYITDVGQHQMWAAQYIRHVKTRSFLTSGGLGTMGYGYGAAIGAAVADGGNRPIVHITGDGSFHMNMNEACTAVSYNLPVITVIMNNSVLGMVRQWQKTFYGKRYSSSEPERKTNYSAVAAGFGATGFRCTNLDEFKAAFTKALELKGPVWIECVIDREEAVLPMIPAGGTVDDMIIN
ncbi:MAG: biosynthetic-type acetolactate synthase large subunit [Clostridia bacterium]|nr:biosynthetic-type acetolactate synthase large subunit [Clostridia bacterium]